MAKSTKSRKSTNAAKTQMFKNKPVQCATLKKMWEAGESYEAMAKATDPHYDPKRLDPTKPTRAKISKARTTGVRIDGKLVKFGARGKRTGEKKGKGKRNAKTNKIVRLKTPEPAVQVRADSPDKSVAS